MGLTVKNKMLQDASLISLDTKIKVFFAGLDSGAQIIHINTFYESHPVTPVTTFVCIYAEPQKILNIPSITRDPLVRN